MTTQPQAPTAAAARKGPPKNNGPSGWKFFLQFSIVSIAAMGALLGFHLAGLVLPVFAADQTYLTLVIPAVFFLGFLINAHRLWATSREISFIGKNEHSKSKHAKIFTEEIAKGRSRDEVLELIKINLFGEHVMIRWITNILVMLGLIGTVIGFLIALGGVAGESITLENLPKVLGQLISGMHVALYTTLVGSVLYVWSRFNYRLLTTGTICLLSELMRIEDRK